MATSTINPIVPKPPAANAAARNPALDFTKGFLVLLMVVYHWFNYFIGPQAGVYKYIRFLTPSFIFITGFMVSNIYFARYDICDLRLPARLATRAVKIIAVFVALNAMISAVLPTYGTHSPISQMLITRFIGTATPGIKDAAFPVLVPIGQLLLLSAALVFVYRFSHYVVHVFCALAFTAVILLRVSAIENSNADLIAIGLLGMVLGMVPVPRLIGIINRPVILAGAYVLFDLAVWYWGEPYVLQVLGVCLNVAIIYLVGASRWAASWMGRIVVLLGKYSLIGYISQIAILQVLRHAMRTNAFETYRLSVSFVLAFVLTTWSVILLSAARKRSGVIDVSYKFLFA